MAEPARADARRRSRPANGYGGALAELLGDLGYDEAPLQAESLDALFALPSARVQAFLAWFLASIRARHSVKVQLGGSTSDYALFQALQRGEHGGLLSEEALVLEEVTAGAQQSETEDTLDELQSANADLEREVQALERRLELTQAKNDSLEAHIHRATLHVDERARERCGGPDAPYFPQLFGEASSASGKRTPTGASAGTSHTALGLKVDAMLEQLVLSDGHEVEMMPEVGVGTTSSRGTSAHSSKFLYHQSMDAMCEKETDTLLSSHAQISRILSGIPQQAPQSKDYTAPTAASSSDVDTNLSSPNERQPALWSSQVDATTLELQEQDLHTYKRCCVELARLEKAYVLGERDALEAELELTRAETRWNQLAKEHSSLRQQYELMSTEAVESRRRELSRAVESTRQQLAECVDHALPRVLEEAAFLKSTTVLLGSYEQKLWRQEGRFLKLRALLDALDLQCARLQLVHRLLDAEAQDLAELDHAMDSSFQKLQNENTQATARLERYDRLSSPGATGTVCASEPTRSSLADTDEVAHTLFDYLEELTGRTHSQPRTSSSSSSFRFRTFDELEQLSNHKNEQETKLADSSRDLEREWHKVLDVKREALQALRSELFGDSSSATPLLLPAELAKALKETIEVKDQTETALDAALESLRVKQRVMALDTSSVRVQQRENLARLQLELQHQKDAGRH